MPKGFREGQKLNHYRKGPGQVLATERGITERRLYFVGWENGETGWYTGDTLRAVCREVAA